jgi:FAD/FMN-containing dehydrogenase
MNTEIDLKNLIGNEKVLYLNNSNLDKDTFLSYGTDRTKLYSPNFDILCFPETTEDVSKLVSYCYQNNLKIVPSGGRTGYAGGAIAKSGEIVISLDKMNQLIDFDPYLPSITVGAGMITQNLHKEAEERGYFFPVDFAATGSSHIGGNIATNAGGVRVVHYGLIRNWILGMKVVDGKGEIYDFNGEILKNNTGYDLKHLFIGSEGTLGIITEVTLKLTTPPKDTNVLLFSVAEFTHILEIFKESHSSGLPVLAFEFFTDTCLEKVMHHLTLNNPFPEISPYYTLVEFEIREESDNLKMDAFMERIAESGFILDGNVSQNSTQRKTFWKYREGISESLSILHTVHKNDISLPLRKMEPFIVEMNDLLSNKYPGFEIALFGHIGDGNLHLNILKPDSMPKEDFFQSCKKVDPEMFTLLQKYNGSISAEHGIGLLKKDFLNFSRSTLEIETMKSIKKIFDPKGILNPGKIF